MDRYKYTKIVALLITLIPIIIPLCSYVFVGKTKTVGEILSIKNTDLFFWLNYISVPLIPFLLSISQNRSKYIFIGLGLNIIVGLFLCYLYILTFFNNFGILTENWNTISDIRKLKLLNYYHVIYVFIILLIDRHFFKKTTTISNH